MQRAAAAAVQVDQGGDRGVVDELRDQGAHDGPGLLFRLELGFGLGLRAGAGGPLQSSPAAVPARSPAPARSDTSPHRIHNAGARVDTKARPADRLGQHPGQRADPDPADQARAEASRIVAVNRWLVRLIRKATRPRSPCRRSVLEGDLSAARRRPACGLLPGKLIEGRHRQRAAPVHAPPATEAQIAGHLARRTASANATAEAQHQRAASARR